MNESKQLERLGEFVFSLPKHRQDALAARISGKRLLEIGAFLGLSTERARQILHEIKKLAHARGIFYDPATPARLIPGAYEFDATTMQKVEVVRGQSLHGVISKRNVGEDPEARKADFDADFVAGFWQCVATRGEDDCWEWKGRRTPEGYGSVTASQKMILAHRLAYVLSYGSPKRGLCVCHTCDNPPCCNPNHLWVGTLGDNTKDMWDKGRAKRGGKPIYRKETHGPR